MFLTGHLDPQGVLEIRPRKVARQYLSTWFLFDAFVVIIEWVEMSVMSNMKGASMLATFRALRMVRTVRLLRMIKVHAMSKVLTEQIRSEEFVLVAHICQIVVMLVLVAHFMACLWYGIGNWLGSDDNW